MFRVSNGFKFVPYKAAPNSSSYRSYTLYTKIHQWVPLCITQFILTLLTLMHLYSFTVYVSENGINLYSTIYVTYVLIYPTSLAQTVGGTLQRSEAIAVLNSVQSSGKSVLFKDVKWDTDIVLQLFALQLFPLNASCCLASGFLLPWLYPDAPWLLTKGLPGVGSLPLAGRIVVTCFVEFYNLFLPAVSCMTHCQVFLIGFTSVKAALKTLR